MSIGYIYNSGNKKKRIRKIFLRLPNSLYTMESVCTRPHDLYVSHGTKTGTLKAFAIKATCAVPARDITAPLANTA